MDIKLEFPFWNISRQQIATLALPESLQRDITPHHAPCFLRKEQGTKTRAIASSIFPLAVSGATLDVECQGRPAFTQTATVTLNGNT